MVILTSFSIVLLIFTVTPTIYARTTLEADNLTSASDLTVARGNVRFTHPDWTITSGYLIINREDGSELIEAREDVNLTTGELTIGCEELRADLRKEEGYSLNSITIIKGIGELDSTTIRGEEIVIEPGDEDLDWIEIRGNPDITLNNGASITGTSIIINKRDEDWEISVTGDAKFEGNSRTIAGDDITGLASRSDKSDGLILDRATVRPVTARIEVDARTGEKKTLKIIGDEADLYFKDDTTLDRGIFSNSTFTTCEGCGGMSGCAYSVISDRTILVEEEVLLGRFVQLRSFGLPAGWAPFYFITLKDTGLPPRPYFPQIGYSPEKGITASAAVPLFLNLENFGNLTFDYYSNNNSFGLGLDYYTGGENFHGLAELYGRYAGPGGNYLKSDANFTADITDWLSVNTDIDYANGIYNGTEYDKNEWSLGINTGGVNPGWQLTARRRELEETTDDSDGTISHVIEDLPQLSLEWTITGDNFPVEMTVNPKVGYYRENKSNWSKDRNGGKGNLNGIFSMNVSPLDSLNFSFTGSGELNGYYQPDEEKLTTRAWVRARPGIRISGPATFTTRFTHQSVEGESIFDFDTRDDLDRLSLDLRSGTETIDHRLNFHYDFIPDDGFSLVNYSINFGTGDFDQDISLGYDIERARLETVTSSTFYASGGLGLNLSTGYDFTTESASEMTAGIQFTGANNRLSLEITGTPFENWAEKVSASTEFNFLDDWTLRLSGTYDIDGSNFSGLSYSLFTEVQNCLDVGISGDQSGVWFDVKLAGF